jgi:hypothetical protein
MLEVEVAVDMVILVELEELVVAVLEEVKQDLAQHQLLEQQEQLIQVVVVDQVVEHKYNLQQE